MYAGQPGDRTPRTPPSGCAADLCRRRRLARPGVTTDQPDADIVDLERRHRAHARVEDRIRDAKNTGLATLPFGDWQRNEVWLELVLCAQALLAWLQRLCLHGDLATATPRTLRYRLLHVGARLTVHARTLHVRLQRTWPWTRHLAAAFTTQIAASRLTHRPAGPTPNQRPPAAPATTSGPGRHPTMPSFRTPETINTPHRRNYPQTHPMTRTAPRSPLTE